MGEQSKPNAAAGRDELESELEALRDRVGELADALAAQRARAELAEARAAATARALAASRSAIVRRPVGPGLAALGGPGAAGGLADEPTGELIRSILRPAELLAALGWSGPEEELARPIPADLRGVIDPTSRRQLVVVPDRDPVSLRRTLCSIIDRAPQPVAVTVVTGPATQALLRDLLSTISFATPAIEFATAADLRPRPDAQRLVGGEELAWDWLATPQTRSAPAVAYVVPGLAAEGSGGVHSVVQEARGMRALGARTVVCVPTAALARAERLYGNGDGLFVEYSRDAAIAVATGDATVAVATEHTSLPLLARLARKRPEVRLAYYVQDYEPLFAELGSGRSDRALLSYGAVPETLLFAKTHFIRNVVGALHGVPVVKVQPSLDRNLFNADGRGCDDRSALTVTAMVRPRTPRRRPATTLAALSMISAALGDRVRIVTFGCDTGELREVGGEELEHVTNLGRLTRRAVADELRRTDVFIDGSAYQAFGRTGLEAMACGAVPLLPSLGGVREFAVDDENAVLVDDDSADSLAREVIALAHDEARLHRLRTAAIPAAASFSIERAARSQLALFTSLATTERGAFRSP